MEVAVSKIFSIYEDALGIRHKDDAYIDIKIYGDFDEFDAYRRRFAPNTETASGFYLGSTNEAIIWKNINVKTMLSVTTHECSHAILGYKVGYSPAWLNEGLAEYFETMEVFGLAVIIPIHKQWDSQTKSRLDTKQLMPLKQYFALSNSQWYEYNGSDGSTYSIAWSLVHFMMSSREGRVTLKGIIQQLESPNILNHSLPNPSSQTTAFSSIDYINKHFYGGLQRFEEEWHHWIKKNKTAHRY